MRIIIPILAALTITACSGVDLFGKAPSVVKLMNPKKGGGTGFFLTTPSGHDIIMTNGHVCNLAENGELLAMEANRITPVKIIKQYEDSDLCALTTYADHPKSLKVAKSYFLHQKISAVGFPLLGPLSISSGYMMPANIVQIRVGANVSTKTCHGKTYHIADGDSMDILQGAINYCVRTFVAIESSILILPGSSGSPVLNMQGNVVGVVFASNEQSRASLVKLEDLIKFLGQL